MELTEEQKTVHLTKEQREIALYLKNGARIEEIAQKSFLSLSYTYEKVRVIKNKLNAKNMKHLKAILSDINILWFYVFMEFLQILPKIIKNTLY